MKAKPPSGLTKKTWFFSDTLRKTVSSFLSINRFVVIQLIGSLSLIGLHLLILSTPLLGRFENIFLDGFFKYRPPISASPAIVYIEIAEDSFQAVRRLPWPRHYHAVLIHILKEWQAKAIVFDMMFSSPSRPSDDVVLSEAFQKSGLVYLPVFLEQNAAQKVWLKSIPEFQTYVKGTGHVNVASDADGVLRRIPPFLAADGVSYPHLALKVAFDYLGKETPSSSKELSFPIDSKGNLLINWAGKWTKTFKHYSYVDVLRSFEAQSQGRNPLISPEAIKGKICLVGFTAAGSTDLKAIPLEPIYPGVGVLANVINSIVVQRFVSQAPLRVNVICLIVIGLIATFLFAPFRNLISFGLGAGLAGIWIMVAYLIFSHKGLWLYVMHPLVLIFSIFIFSALYAKILGDKEKIYFFRLSTRDGLTGLYVMRHFRMLLDREIHNVQIRKEPISLILIDIDNFKHINDTYGHQAGDEILKKTAQIIQSATRVQSPFSEDFVARYGGEEFIVMLPKTPLTQAAFNVSERIRKSVEDHAFEWDSKRIPVTISLGVSTLGSGDKTADALIQKADRALYRAKRAGKNRTCLEEESNSESVRKSR